MNGLRFIGLLCITFCVIGIIANWEPLLAWVELHPGLASWVQGFGTIAAIYGSAYTARAMFEREVDRVEAQTRQQENAKLTVIVQLLLTLHVLAKQVEVSLDSAALRNVFMREGREIDKRLSEVRLFELPIRDLGVVLPGFGISLRVAMMGLEVLNNAQTPADKAGWKHSRNALQEISARSALVAAWITAVVEGDKSKVGPLRAKVFEMKPLVPSVGE